MAAVSVLVTTLNPGSALQGFVRSIDAQTVPASEFELVVVDASSDGSADRLRQLGGRRPNVTVVTAEPEGTAADRLGLALERATGEYVLVVAQQQLLAPRALELLLDRARSTGADLVLGRVVTEKASGSLALPEDADRLEVSEDALDDCVAMVRRTLPAGAADPGAALLDVAALAAEAATVSAVGRYACVVREATSSGRSEDVSLDAPTCRWVDGMLHVTVTARLPEPVQPVVRAWLVVTQGPAEVALPATTAVDEADRSALTASVVLDPATAEGGHPLGDGPWNLLLRLAWAGHEVTAPLPPGPSRSAVVAGRPHVVHAAGQVLELDAGATRTSVVGPVPAARASVTETVHGTVVTLDLRDLHVHGDGVLDARLLLDGLGMPGRLVCHDGRARLEAYVGSLAGTRKVAVVAGGGKPVPTRLRLRVGGTGGMVLEDEPAPAPTSPVTSTGGPAPLVQRLRRRLPRALEPAVSRLARVPVLRQGYRRLISR